MKRARNFSAGPAILPESVLEKVQSEMLSYRDSGMSVMEMSHRSSLFEEIISDAEQLLRELMNIPEGYKVLFLQGGASLQFLHDSDESWKRRQSPVTSTPDHGLKKPSLKLKS